MKERLQTHHRHPLKPEPSPVAKVPPRLDLLDDQHALEPDAVRALLVVPRLVRHGVAGHERGAEVGCTVGDADLRLVDGKVLPETMTCTMTAVRGGERPVSQMRTGSKQMQRDALIHALAPERRASQCIDRISRRPFREDERVDSDVALQDSSERALLFASRLAKVHRARRVDRAVTVEHCVSGRRSQARIGNAQVLRARVVQVGRVPRDGRRSVWRRLVVRKGCRWQDRCQSVGSAAIAAQGRRRERARRTGILARGRDALVGELRARGQPANQRRRENVSALRRSTGRLA